MKCATLYTLFGRDTRPTQVINVGVSICWAIALALNLYGVVEVNLPTLVKSHSASLFHLAVVTTFFGAMGLITIGRAHQVFKAFGLVLGALGQAILANGFVSKFPPLDMLMVVCAGLSVWYMLAVLYILKCEGING